MPSCMYVSPAGLILLSFCKPSSIFDLHSQITKHGQNGVNKDWYELCVIWLLMIWCCLSLRRKWRSKMKERKEREVLKIEEGTCRRSVAVWQLLWLKRLCRKPSSWDWHTHTHTHKENQVNVLIYTSKQHQKLFPVKKEFLSVLWNISLLWTENKLKHQYD